MSDDGDEFFERVAQAGLNRFFDEGMSVWSRKQLEVLFKPLSLEDQRVQRIIRRWSEAGSIRLLLDDDAFLEVMTPVP
jgi:hypothetical protein